MSKTFCCELEVGVLVWAYITLVSEKAIIVHIKKVVVCMVTRMGRSIVIGYMEKLYYLHGYLYGPIIISTMIFSYSY